MPIILNLLAAILGALGQWFYKVGGQQIGQIPLYKNWSIFLGMILFCVVMVLFLYAFKLGGRLSIVYPVYATTFIWGMLLAVFVDHEPWHSSYALGLIFIIVGVGTIAIGKN
jgi:drug/metabolite transporter (DMT)-like permease